VKVLAHARTADPQRVERFMQEARVTAALDHPNVVRVYDVGHFGDRAYLVAELLEGETLRARISRGPMPIAEVIRIGVEVARGLDTAHAAGLVHRDLKPDNIFLTRTGTTKILDFGIAKLAQHDAGRDKLATVTGVVLGTAGYLAPEQIRGETVDARADLFALGSVLFEMLTGSQAFGRDHMVDTLHAILHDPTPDPGAQRDALPGPLGDLVMKLLEKSPDARVQSAPEVIASLQLIVAHRPARPRVRRLLAFRRRSTSPRGRRAGLAGRLLLGIGLMILLAAAAGAWILSRGPTASRRSPDEQANEAYLRGRALVLRPIAADLKQAAGFFQEAITLDPGFPDAWAGLASAYKRMPITGALPPREAFPRAEEAARRALSLDPNNAEAYAALGTKAFWFDWDYPAAERLLTRALELQPTLADAHLFLAHLYSNIGRADEALRSIRRARDLDRQWAQPRALEGQFLTWARKYSDAVAHLDVVTTVTDPGLWTAHAFRADALLALGKADEAVRAYERAMALGGHAFQHGQRTIFLAAVGRRREAEEALATIAPQQNYARALSLQALGRKEEAIAELSRAIDARMVMVTFIGVEPKWDALRGWQPFRDAARRVNLLEVSDRIAAAAAAGR
jgi:serine/threonine-protein kinase